jgi:hypothetical protein
VKRAWLVVNFKGQTGLDLNDVGDAEHRKLLSGSNIKALGVF